MKRAKPIISRNGGKTRLLPHLLPLLRPHRTYVEAFAGGLALLLAKPRSQVEIVNDIDSDLVSLYRCAQWHLEPLIQEVEWLLSSREDLAALVAQPGLTDLQRAGRFLLCNRLSFGGGGSTYAVSKAQGAKSRQATLQALRAIRDRLDRVSIEHLSYERLFTLYDSPETLWFLDPPYLDSDAAMYRGWNEAEMRAFAALAQDLAGDWIITVDDSPLNRDLWARHDVTPVVTRNGGVNRLKHPSAAFGELIIRRRPQRRCKTVAPAIARPLKQAA